MWSTAISQDGEQIFVPPTDAGGVGIFVIEFSQNTKLEKNYYLPAKKLTFHFIALESKEENLYLLVDISSDDNFFDSYNDHSFDW